MNIGSMRPFRLAGLLLCVLIGLGTASHSSAADLKGGTLRVAILADVNDFDPQSFLGFNFPLIKNFYDSLLEYTPQGEAIESLASAWPIAPDNRSVTLKLRSDVMFTSGAPLDAEAVSVTLKKAA